MRIYKAHFEGYELKEYGFEVELQDGNTMSVIYTGGGGSGNFIFWGGKVPRPYWMAKEVQRIRRLIFDTDYAERYIELLESVAKTARLLTRLEKDGQWPWWGEMYTVLQLMSGIEKRGGALWENPINEANLVFGELLPMQGKDETLTKLLVYCGFGFSGEIINTAGDAKGT